jgi:IS4 transposase
MRVNFYFLLPLSDRRGLFLLATKYHQRWEAENTMDELKTYLNRRKTPTRSLKQE